MKAGKVSQTVYRRSVLKQLHTDEHTALFLPSREESCFGIHTEGGEQILSCNVTLYGNEPELCVFAVARAANELAARGARMKGAAIHVLLPESAREAKLKAMLEAGAYAAKAQGITVLCAGAETVPALTTAVVHLTAMGIFLPGALRRSNMAKPEEDIVLLKWIGLEGTLRIKAKKEKELAQRFIPVFMKQIDSYKEALFSLKEIEAADAVGVSAMHQITDGGILSALWELAEGAGIGLSVDMKKMSVKQETIEVCEYFHLNPYQLAGAGSILVVTPKGEELADALTREGMQAVVLGHTHKGKERIIMNGAEQRFLERDAPDELTKI